MQRSIRKFDVVYELLLSFKQNRYGKVTQLLQEINQAHCLQEKKLYKKLVQKHGLGFQEQVYRTLTLQHYYQYQQLRPESAQSRQIKGAPPKNSLYEPDLTRKSYPRQQLRSDMADHSYKVDICTGNLRGSGTESKAQIKLIGEKDESDLFVVGVNDQGEEGFAMGSTQSYNFQIHKDLGSLKRVYVHLEEVKDEFDALKHDWYLEQIVVEKIDLYRNLCIQKQIFPCKAWVGRSRVSEETDQGITNLIPLTLAQQVKPQAVKISGSGYALANPEKTDIKQSSIIQKSFGNAGEDSYFNTPGRGDVYGLGVADGVHMWREQGIDAGQFSRALMQTAKNQVHAGQLDVLKVVKLASRKCQTEGIYGSSTICVITINQNNGLLQSSNIGDSGYMVIGKSDFQDDRTIIRYRSPQQEHSFGYPYQLGHQPNADKPEDAQLFSTHLQKGDSIVVGSDGLFDNVDDEEIKDFVIDARQNKLTPFTTAMKLAAKAYSYATDKNCTTPFSIQASEMYDLFYQGGKLDDITVVVAYVS